MSLKQRNVFTKGIVADLAYNHVKQDNWVFPSKNIRIFNKRGQGYVVSTLPGNEMLFDVGEGSTVIAAVEHRGIVYLITMLGGTAYTAVGCYPYPEAWAGTFIDPTLIGFEDRYGILRNMTNNGLFGDLMISDLYGYHEESNLKLIVDDAFDESANLYLCDGENIDKVVNSGFKRNGGLNGKSYNIEDFEGELNHILFSVKPPIADPINVLGGGTTRPGNYYYYYRYETSTFDKTEFFPCSFPVSIFDGETASDIMGSFPINEVGTEITIAKKVELLLSNLDTAFKYLRIGVVFYSSKEDGNIISSTYLISKRYNISNLINNGGRLIIFGNESEEILTLTELGDNQLEQRISTDHIISNQRMFKVNLKGTKRNNNIFSEYALNITINSEEFDIEDKSYDEIVNDVNNSPYAYQKASKITDSLGYFPAEIYPFAIMLLFTDGIMSEAYPMKGSDGLGLANATNDNGLYRFPYVYQTKGLRAVFDFTTATTFYNDNIELFVDVKAIYIVRGERIKNFICEGYFVNTAYGVNSATGHPKLWFMSDSEAGAYHMPITPSDGAPPSTYGYQLAGAFYRPESNSLSYIYNYGLISSKRYALYSPDIMFNPKKIVGNNTPVYIRYFAPNTISDINVQTQKHDTRSVPSTYLQEHKRYAGYPTIKTFTAKTYIIEKGTWKGESQFSSYAEDGETPDKKYMFRFSGDQTGILFDLWNRSRVHPSYLGIVSDNDIHYDGLALATIYQNEPDGDFMNDQNSVFDVSGTTYSTISNPFTLENNGLITMAKGDNFIQKIWVRTVRHLDRDSKIEGEANKSYYYGELTGFTVASSINSVLRNLVSVTDDEGSDSIYSFFPANLNVYPEPRDWILASNDDNTKAESMQLNHGYNKTEQDIKYLGFDSDAPIDSVIKSTRIAFSDKYTAEAFFDAYRRMGSENYQDYSTNFGAMIRVVDLYGLLLTVREKGVFRHFVGQKKQTASEEDVVLSPVSIYLSDEDSPIMYHGIQDWHAIVLTKQALYGVDFNDEVIWSLSISTSQGTDRKSAGGAVLSSQYAVEKKVRELIGTLNKVRTSPIVQNGIALGFNESFGEVYFTFLNGESIETLVFSENMKFFIANSDIDGSLYIPFKKDILSVCNKTLALKSQVQMNDVEGLATVFNGAERSNIISFIVNGNTEEENSVILTKIFESIEILCPHVLLDTITYETELQKGEYTFTEDSAEFWKDSEWVEGSWLVPIVRENIIDKDDYYQEGSVLRGRWVKITLSFKAGIEFQISDIITTFNKSFS